MGLINKDAPEMLLSLEKKLAFLALYGRPRLAKLDEGWHCRLDVLVSGTGVEFSVMSEYNHPTPAEAAQCCMERLGKALDSLSNPGTKS